MAELDEQHPKASREARRIADQLGRSWRGEAWHGPSVREVLADVDEAAARRRPIATAHTIWELLLHVTGWQKAALSRFRGETVELADEDNFPAMDGSWSEALGVADAVLDALVAEVQASKDDRLWEKSAGCPYNNYFLLHGVVQHNLYHAGQIMVLRRA